MGYPRTELLDLRFWWKTSSQSNCQTSRHCSKNEVKSVPKPVWNSLKQAGILKRFRGSRGGQPKVDSTSDGTVVSSNVEHFDDSNSEQIATEPEQRNANNLIHSQPSISQVAADATKKTPIFVYGMLSQLRTKLLVLLTIYARRI